MVVVQNVEVMLGQMLYHFVKSVILCYVVPLYTIYLVISKSDTTVCNQNNSVILNPQFHLVF
jgi:hypothetical protein